MSPEDAFTRLGLKGGATADEVRQAYRDLVKVWHPDRFGSEARLRAKAESQLKEINAAYRTLAVAGFRTDFEGVRPTESSAAAAGERSRVRPAAAPPKPSGRFPELTLRIALYAGSTVLLVGMGIFLGHRVRPALHSETKPAAVPVSINIPAPATTSPTRHNAARLSGAHSGTPGFRVWNLSQADSDRVQMACSARAPGTEDYRHCIAAQLNALKGSSAVAEIPGMSTAEREAVEAACSRTKASSDRGAYNRCLKQQVAELATEPVRPNLTGFSEADRVGMERACARSRGSGAAEYDRCLTRFVRTLRNAVQ